MAPRKTRPPLMPQVEEIDENRSEGSEPLRKRSAKPERFRKEPRSLRESFDATEERSAATLDYLATH